MTNVFDVVDPDAYAASDAGMERGDIEFLLPSVVRRYELEDAPFLNNPPGAASHTRESLERRRDDLGPWTQKFRLGHEVETREGMAGAVAAARLRYRRGLITSTAAELLGDDIADATSLDIGCNSGFFSLDFASRGARRAYGIDLREANIARAHFLADHYAVPNCDFSVVDAEAEFPESTFDVVFNLGLMYHVTDPLGVLQRTFDATERFAIVDTIVKLQRVSAFFTTLGKDTESLTEGRYSLELQPTYRAMIDLLQFVGFSEVLEIVTDVEWTHEKYLAGRRRCFLAIK
ncbi:MAG: class I SAM-dependent methyltransferase [Actinomycetota bacterium]